MKNVFVYSLETGQILRTQGCAVWDISIQAFEGEEFYLNAEDYPNATHIIDGEPVTLKAPIEELKVTQIDIINRQRISAERKPFLYLDKPFDADEASIKRITLAVQAAQICFSTSQPFSVLWTCADNSFIELDALQMLGIVPAMVQRGVDIHEKAKTLKGMIATATTAEEVEAILWDSIE